MVSRAREFGGSPSHPSKGLIFGIAVAFAAIVILGLVAVFVTRSGSPFSAVSTTNQTSAVASSAQQVSSSSQAQTSGGNFTRPANAVRIGSEFLVTVTSVKPLEDIKPLQAHLKYVVIELTVQNVGSRANNVGSDDEFVLFDSEGQRAGDIGGSAAYARLGALGSKVRESWGAPPAAPGQTVERTLIYTILADTEPARLEFSNRDTGKSGTIPLK